MARISLMNSSLIGSWIFTFTYSTVMNTILHTIFPSFYLGHYPRNKITGSKGINTLPSCILLQLNQYPRAYSFYYNFILDIGSAFFPTLWRYNWYVKQLHIINVYNLVSLDVCIHSCYYHHNPRNKHSHHLQKFPG